jgi:ubiquinol-cytochrome c reductase cytochrome b subunit
MHLFHSFFEKFFGKGGLMIFSARFSRSFLTQSWLKLFYKIAFLYPSPINLNYWWNFGSLAFIVLVSQILTGVFLAAWYIPHVNFAFESVEYIMREVQYGWLYRYIHANGASFFFLLVYIHMFRGLYYGSYLKPRQFVWTSGMFIFVLMIATAFLGYVLPWGQMSYRAATVITSLIAVIPFIGESLLLFIWGGFYIEQPTLTKFYSFHFVLPFLILGLVVIHIIMLHEYGSNNPLGINSYKDSIPFGPYFIMKDLYGFFVFLLFFCCIVFFVPNITMHPDNYIKANTELTPRHIVPEWYFLPFYGLLRSIPSKSFGVLCLLFGLIVLFLIPFLYTNKIRSGKFKPLFKIFFWFFVTNVILLGWSGGKPLISPFLVICCWTNFFYFFFLIFLFPIVNLIDEYLLRR